MALKDKSRKSNFLKTFQYAIDGVTQTIRNERNMQIHVTIAILVIIAGVIFSVSKIEWLFILFTIGGVFALEMLNTAIERVVDLVTEDFHPLAKQAKDIAAGAVFVYAIMAVLIGIMIFFPKVSTFF